MHSHQHTCLAHRQPFATSNMEAHANAVEDVLVDGLSYKLKNSAKYITDRKSVTCHPSGSNIYRTSAGTKVLKVSLTGDHWMVPDSVRLMFTLRNTANNVNRMLRTLSGPWSFWRRMRILCGGQVVEDFDYNKAHEMIAVLRSEAARDNDDIEGFGYRYDDKANSGAASTISLPGIAGGCTKRVSFKLLSGLLGQPKWLPIRYFPVTIELELVNGATDPIVAIDGVTFTAANTSTDWQIEDVQLKADLCTLDNAVDNQIADHLLSGKPLPIHFRTLISQSQVVSGYNLSVNVSRAVTRLARIFMSFGGPNCDARSRPWNNFFHPMAGTYDPAHEIEYQVQIGSKLFPEYPVQASSEAFAQLKKAVIDGHGADYHSISIKAPQYQKDKFVLAVQTSKLSQAGFTGLNTRSGDLMTIKAKLVGGSAATQPANLPTEMFIMLESDQILEVRDTGATVFD